jgi:hypothetical protein
MNGKITMLSIFIVRNILEVYWRDSHELKLLHLQLKIIF